MIHEVVGKMILVAMGMELIFEASGKEMVFEVMCLEIVYSEVTIFEAKGKNIFEANASRRCASRVRSSRRKART